MKNNRNTAKNKEKTLKENRFSIGNVLQTYSLLSQKSLV
jgi:ABC-type methionine transport system ATPase subunit